MDGSGVSISRVNVSLCTLIFKDLQKEICSNAHAR